MISAVSITAPDLMRPHAEGQRNLLNLAFHRTHGMLDSGPERSEESI